MIIKSYTFEAQPVLMDFHDFRHCIFRRCRLIFCGYSDLRIDNCRFEDCRWEFGGPAMLTLQLLSNFHKSGTEMGRLIVQQAINIITQSPDQPAQTTPQTQEPPPPAVQGTQST
ncbi:MAG: hypothetical protein N3G20_11980, partial [Verrucomicrobiae bacterium]|nr:hypothetical protein [Verrucomicrobiae bacterium]